MDTKVTSYVVFIPNPPTNIFTYCTCSTHRGSCRHFGGFEKFGERQSSQCNGSLAYKLITVKGTLNSKSIRIRYKGAVRARCLKWYHCLSCKEKAFCMIKRYIWNISPTV